MGLEDFPKALDRFTAGVTTLVFPTEETFRRNDLRYPADSYVYFIFDAVSLETYKYGITSVTDPDSRPENQVRRLNRDNPTSIYSYIYLAGPTSRIEARIYESSLIISYAVTHGFKLPPGQVFNIPKDFLPPGNAQI